MDKTALIFMLAKDGGYYFLSRPRRFGKSLLLTTLKAYFQGRKEFFEGLAISELEKDWTVYPVLHIDLNAANYINVEALQSILSYQLIYFEKTYGPSQEGRSLSERFMDVIRHAYEQTGQQVVILVDEYDKPLLQAMENAALQDDYRKILKSFYGAAKTMDNYIRLAFFTGGNQILQSQRFQRFEQLERHFIRSPLQRNLWHHRKGNP